MFLFSLIYLFRSIYILPIWRFSCRIADFYLKHSQAFSFKLCYSRQLWPDAVDGPEMIQDTESSDTRQHYGVSVCVWMHECVCTDQVSCFQVEGRQHRDASAAVIM